jgi:ribonuclease D
MPAAQAPAADWITDPATLEAWLAAIADGDMLGLDTEFMRRNTFHPQLALLQLGHAGRYALIDPLAFDLGDTLQRHIGVRPMVCVMHSAGEDLETLTPQLPQGPSTLFDTQLAAAFAGLGLGLSYRALVAQFDGVDLDKGETRSDWMRRPLTASQKAYATLDVVYLENLHAQLRERLRLRGREAWFAEDCERLKQRAGQVDGSPQPQRDLRGAAEWPGERQALLRRVLVWREQAARRLDKPRPWLLDDAHALDLVQHTPADASQLAERTRGQRALRAAQRDELLALLQAPVTAQDMAATAPIPGFPHGETKRAFGEMKQAVDALAVELDLPAGLLCPRKALEEYVVTRHWPEHLEGWRRGVLHDRLAALLP